MPLPLEQSERVILIRVSSIIYLISYSIQILGTSTLYYKILNDCSASVRKCREGLDYFVAEGGRGAWRDYTKS